MVALVLIVREPGIQSLRLQFWGPLVLAFRNRD